MDELLRGSRFATTHVPLDPAIKRMLVNAQFALLKPDALIVNVSRGEVVDEDALRAALESGLALGAALDVRVVEPPELPDVVSGRNDVLLTAHLAGLPVESTLRLQNMYCRR